MNRRAITMAVLVTAVMAICGSAAASDKLCVKTRASFTDNVKDRGANHLRRWGGNGNRPMNGARIQLVEYLGGSCGGSINQFVTASGNLDHNGCMTIRDLNLNRCYRVKVYTEGTPKGPNNSPRNFLQVANNSGVSSAAIKSFWPSSSGTHNVNLTETEGARIYAAMAHSMRWFRGATSNKTLRVYRGVNTTNCPCAGGGGSFSCGINANESHICLDSNSRDRKFVMAHEWGHSVLALNSAHPKNDCSRGGAGHALTSIEYQSCALGEGWANFVSAAVWNDDDHVSNPHARIGYWGTGFCGGTIINSDTEQINVDSGTGSCPIRYMENTTTWSSYHNRSTELDWMRALWDFRSDNRSEPGNRVSHTKMIKSFKEANFGTSGAVYERLRKGVAKAVNCTHYERLVWAASLNGTDHCWGETSTDENCADVPGCTDIDSKY